MKIKGKTKVNAKENIYDFIYIILGCVFAGFGTSVFLLPNKLSSGGFSGIATIIYYFYEIPMGTSILLLNIPIFIWGYLKFGKKFIIKTIISTILYSEFINIFEKIDNFVEDRFLSSIYGGIFVGIGLAFVFKANSSTGGSDLVAQLFQEYNSNISVSNILVVLDIIIVAINLIAFRNIEIGLYSAIAIYLSGKMIDVVFEGINFCKLMYIISDKYEEILNNINKKANRGATGLYGKGSYTNKDKLIILCATKRRDVVNIKKITKEIDKNAFIIITDAREVYGLGFK